MTEALGPDPRHLLRDLTEEEHRQYDQLGYVKFEPCPESSFNGLIGRYWTKRGLDNAKKD